MYNSEDIISEIRDVQSQNNELEQRLVFLKLLLTRSSYEMRNPKQAEI